MSPEKNNDVIYHSVCLDTDLCKGCTMCMRHCPTQAIRVQNGKAKIIKERCIDCGECVRRCPYHAKKVQSDAFDKLKDYEYNIALVPPAFFGQFPESTDVDVILTALLNIGFDDAFEVARGAEVITQKTRELLNDKERERPIISSACPAVVRLIAVRFPSLADHIIPLTSPMEAAAQLARKEAMEKTGLPDEKIGTFFLTPCTAKITATKQPLALGKSDVSGVIPVKDVYKEIAREIKKVKEPRIFSKAGRDGISWARSGGEAKALGIKNYISIDGIHNVINILEALEDDKLKDVEFIEALACVSGCTGGPLNVENEFIANSKIRNIADTLPETSQNGDGLSLFWKRKIVYKPISPLAEDMGEAMRKMKILEEIYERLPQLDCGSCGSPSCRDFAEDIVRGKAQERDCIFRLREKIELLAKEITEISKMINE